MLSGAVCRVKGVLYVAFLLSLPLDVILSGAVCRVTVVLYVASLPFLPLDVILSGAAEKGVRIGKRRQSRGGVEVFVVEA